MTLPKTGVATSISPVSTPLSRNTHTRVRLIIAIAVAASLIGFGCSSSSVDDEVVGGYQVGQINYGEDQCPTASVVEVSSAFPELGRLDAPTLATEGPQYVCNFGGDGTGRLRLIGGNTGKSILRSWKEWTTTEPVPQPVNIYEVGSTEVWMLATEPDGMEAAFKGSDNAVWRANAVLEGKPERELDIELTMVRSMLNE